MKKLKYILLMVAVLTTCAAGLQAEPVGTVVSIRGKAAAAEPGGGIRILELKSPVFRLDKIKTEEGSSLQMMFLDESVVSQGEKSEMTIDEYVYNPSEEEKNSCLLSFGKGVFRAVTARMTALNPDGFKVKTKRAVIGIRGCEVAFNITERGENIYVLSLPDGKSIVITLNAGVDSSALTAGGTVDKEKAISIIQAGVMVSIEEDGGVTQRPVTPQEAIDLIEGITAPTGGSAPANTGSDNLTDSAGQESNQEALEEEEEETIEELTPPPPPPPLEEPVEEPAEVISPVLEFSEKGSGIGWKWGVWQYPGPIFDKVSFLVQDPYSLISGADVLSFVSLSSVSGFNLTRTGSTAALIQDGANKYLLSGECEVSFNVPAGVGSTTWSAGSLSSISDGTHSLDFMINGTVDGGGVLKGNFSSYTLNSGVTYDQSTIQSSTIDASLIGPDAVTPEGILGRFNVLHFNGTSVQGGFAGTDAGVN